MKRYAFAVLGIAMPILSLAEAGTNPFSRNSSASTQAAFRGVMVDERLNVEVRARKLDGVPEWIQGPSFESKSTENKADGSIDYGPIGDSLVHLQVVVTTASGRVIDTVGWGAANMEDLLDDKPGRILGMKEEKKRIERGDYSEKPLYSATMEARDYFDAKNKWMNKYEDRSQRYTELNNANPLAFLFFGQDESELLRPREYVGEDDLAQMCRQFVANNCWIGAEDFTKIADGMPSVVVSTPFTFPGAGGLIQERQREKQLQQEAHSNTGMQPSLQTTTQMAPVPSSTPPTAPANQTQTIDNRQMKQWAANQINSAYSQACSIADAEGVGGEYRSAVGPVVNQSLNAIGTIPDQQTIVVPAQ